MTSQIVRPFSAGYFMLNANVLSHTGETAIMPHDLSRELTQYVTRPLIRLANGHIWSVPEKGIPADTIAVPSGDLPVSDTDPVLMARQGTMNRLVESGEQSPPA